MMLALFWLSLLCLGLSLHANGVLLKSSDGTDIYAVAQGNPKNPPIVFVHGYTFSAMVFEDIFKDERLLDNFYLVSHDLRGHGRSGKPLSAEGYGSRLFADDFATVIDHFHVKSPLYAGWSYGGMPACDVFAHLPPRTISGIFAIAAFPTINWLYISDLTKRLIPLIQTADDVSVNINGKLHFTEACFADASSLPTNLLWKWLGCAVMQPPPASVELLQRTQDPSKLFEAGSQGFPYMAIYGTGDKLVENESITMKLQSVFTNIQVHRIASNTHAPFVDHKNEFIEVLVPFANKVLSKDNPWYTGSDDPRMKHTEL